MRKRVLLTIGLSVLLVLVIAGATFAQGTTPPATPKASLLGRAFGGGMFGGFTPFGGWQSYDAIAKALNLTPTQLFEQLHSGKTLAEIAKVQNVDMQVIQDAMKATRNSQAREAIQKGLDSGKFTKEQADWMSKGLENGWGRGGAKFPRRPVK